MPHIRVRGTSQETVMKVSGALVDSLHSIVGCPRDWFILEHITATYISDGTVATGPILIDVLWFKRPGDTQDRVATALTDAFKPYAGEEDVYIFFIPLQEENYYDNGKPCG